MITATAVAATAADHGLRFLACVPVPDSLDPAGYDRLLADGIGDMAWLAEHRDLRLAPAAFAPWARSLVVVALPYRSRGPAGALKRARYAAGADYHGLLRKKLARLGRDLGAGRCRATVDSAPVNERSLAKLAGLGWIGRNALLLRPDLGSFHVLGCLFTEAVIETRHGGHGADRCGTCTACETACPTAALSQRRVLSERCISYLTIEHRGVIPRALAARFDGWWFGCDRCQEVCPWNRFAPGPGDHRLDGEDDHAATLLALTAADFDQHFAGTAVRRLGWPRLRRNLLVACWSLERFADAASVVARSAEPLVFGQARELGLAVAAG